MPTYKYSAIGTDGRTVSGRLDAPNRTECVAELRKRMLTPIDIQEKGGARPSASAPAPAPSSSSSGPPARPPPAPTLGRPRWRPGPRRGRFAVRPPSRACGRRRRSSSSRGSSRR